MSYGAPYTRQTNNSHIRQKVAPLLCTRHISTRFVVHRTGSCSLYCIQHETNSCSLFCSQNKQLHPLMYTKRDKEFQLLQYPRQKVEASTIPKTNINFAALCTIQIVADSVHNTNSCSLCCTQDKQLQPMLYTRQTVAASVHKIKSCSLCCTQVKTIAASAVHLAINRTLCYRLH